MRRWLISRVFYKFGSTMMMDISWDTRLQSLSGWAMKDNVRIRINIPRMLIHAIPIYNDAIENEIERYKNDIIERLLPSYVMGATAKDFIQNDARTGANDIAVVVNT